MTRSWLVITCWLVMTSVVGDEELETFAVLFSI